MTQIKLQKNVLLLPSPAPSETKKVLKHYQQGDFIPLDSYNPPRLYLGTMRYWVSFTLENRGSENSKFILFNNYTMTNRKFKLYTLEGDTITPFQQDKKKQGSKHIFTLTIPPGSSKTFFIYHHRYRFRVRITLYNQDEFQQFQLMEFSFTSFFFGILFIITVYNLLLFLSFRNKSYGYYILFNIVLGIYYLLIFLQVSSDIFPIDYLMIALRNLVTLLFACFSGHFLRAKKYTPRLNRLLTCLIWFFILIIPFVILTGRYIYSYVEIVDRIALTAVCILILVIGITVYVKKYRPARFFIIATFSFLLVMILYGLYNFLPWVPRLSIEGMIIRLHPMSTAVIVMIALFSFGLADGVNVMREEKEAALKKAVTHAAQTSELQTEKERLKQELEFARKVQTLLLPDKDFIHPEFDIEVAMVPAKEVGGDYYDICFGKDNSFWISIGDVSGHGVKAGLIMMITLVIHATITHTMDLSPSSAVKKLNTLLMHYIHHNLGKEQMMSFSTLKYGGKGKFIYSGLHLPFIIYRKAEGCCEVLDTAGMYLNMISDISEVTDNRTFRLSAGDMLFLYTDGIIEARDKTHAMLDLEGLQHIIKDNCHKKLSELKNIILEETLQWCDYDQKDDMTLIILRLH